MHACNRDWAHPGPSACVRQWLLLIICSLILLPTGGCANAKQGAVSGAGIGALTGLAIGSISGNAGEGAAIGAIVGGVGGAVIGDQNRRKGEAAKATGPTPQTAPMNQYDKDRLALARLARRWSVTGWETVEGERRLVSGTASGVVEGNFFVRLDMSIADDTLSNRRSEGTTVLGSEPGRGVTMSSRFSTSPMTFSYVGRFSADGEMITFEESDKSSRFGRRVVIRFLSLDEFVVDATDTKAGGEPRASLRFTGVQ